jgi:hypothetical protein
MSKAVREIKKATRKYFTAEKKIQIVLEGLRGEISVSELCRREGVASVTKFFCSDQKSGKYSCLSISWDYEILLTIDIDGSDYFLANYDLKTKSDRLRLSYYTGKKEIWTSYDGRKDLIRQTKEGHIQWKNKNGEMVTYKRFKGDRLPASFK